MRKLMSLVRKIAALRDEGMPYRSIDMVLGLDTMEWSSYWIAKYAKWGRLNELLRK